MQTFDLLNMPVFSHSEREKNVFYQDEMLKGRLIILNKGGSIPACQMTAKVVFLVLNGTVEIMVNGVISKLTSGQMLITDPAEISMKAVMETKLCGLQITV